MKANGKAEGAHDFAMKCPGCEVILSAPDKDGILRVYDVHVAKSHQASPAQWAEANKRIEAAAEAMQMKRKRGGGE